MDWEICSTTTAPRSSSYGWVLSCQGLMPPHRICSTACWMYASALTGWRRSLEMYFDFEPHPPASTRQYAFRWTTLGTRLLYGSDPHQYETNTQALRNVRRLRISKYLTFDDLREQLTATPVAAMRRWSSYVFGTGGSRMSGKTSSRSSRPGSSNRAWTDSGSDPIQDVCDWISWWRENSELYGRVPEAERATGSLRDMPRYFHGPDLV